MTYKISDGIPESALVSWLSEAKKKYGTFKDGRVNYTKADIAPVVMCTVTYKDKLLLAKRGYGLADAEGYWSTINGFIDEIKPVKAQVIQEVSEELGITITNSDIQVTDSYTIRSSDEKRQYIVFPCLVTLSHKPKIILNEEHTDFAWVKRNELASYDTLDDLPYAIDTALALR
jgi:NADH pyrophosphatase NudC (nudix superfamily)